MALFVYHINIVMEYKFKYAAQSDRIKGQCKGAGNAINPLNWMHGPNPIIHDQYYAWLRHRAQAKFRGETHDLTFEQWLDLWPEELWLQRGRDADSLCLSRVDFWGDWEISNVEVMSRREHLRKKRKREYKLNGR